MTGGRVDQTDIPEVLRGQQAHLRSLDALPERWIIVGTYPTDAGTTFDSPPFQNGWVQAGPPNELLAFVLRPNGWVEIRGVPTGGADGTVVFTLPAGYRPSQTETMVSHGDGDGTTAYWHVDPSGDVTFETSCLCGASALEVTDGTHSEANVTKIKFTSGATVSSGGAGEADVAISAGGGAELDYVERTTDLIVSATSDGNGGADAYIDGNSVTYSGSQRIKIEAWVPFSIAANGDAVLNLYDGTTDLGRLNIAAIEGVSGQSVIPMYGVRFLTPTAGAHTFHIRAWKTSGGATVILRAGVGGASTAVPAWYRITTA